MTTKERTMLSALIDAQNRFCAIADLLHNYPRPSQDPNGRLLLDAQEIAKSAAIATKWNIDNA